MRNGLSSYRASPSIQPQVAIMPAPAGSCSLQTDTEAHGDTGASPRALNQRSTIGNGEQRSDDGDGGGLQASVCRPSTVSQACTSTGAAALEAHCAHATLRAPIASVTSAGATGAGMMNCGG